MKTVSSTPASNAPADPAKRLPLNAPTWYPGVADVEEAAPLILHPGEVREGVDITMLRSLSFCVAGNSTGGRIGKATPHPSISRSESPAFVSGTFGHQSMRIIDTNPPLRTGKSDGKFRICDLPRGTWRIWMTQGPGINPPSSYGSVTFSITDSDIRDLIISPSVGTSLAGEVVLDATGTEAAPDKAGPDKAGSRRSGDMGLIVALQSLHAFRTLTLALRPWTRAPLPGTFSISDIFAGDYAVSVSGLNGNIYVKDVTYGGRSVLNEPFHVESVMTGIPLRA